MSKWGKFGQPLHLMRDHVALTGKKLRDRPAKGRIGNPMGAVGWQRQIAALDLVRPLRARLDARQPVGDGEFDRLIVAAFKMQELVVAIAAPIAAVDRVLAEKVERPAT